MKALFLATLLSVIFFSCKKNDTPVVVKDNFSYSGFTSTDYSTLQLAQRAVIDGGKLVFNKNSQSGFGNAIFKEQVSVANGFETTINFTITGLGGINDIDGNLGGDGISFVLFNTDTTYLKTAAWHLIPSSFSTEVDTYHNGDNDDPNGNHLAIYSVNASNVESSSRGFATNIPNVSDGNAHTLKVVYKNGTYSVYMDGSATPYVTTTVDLSALVPLNNGKAYVGIACMAGLSLETHTINSWSFNSY